MAEIEILADTSMGILGIKWKDMPQVVNTVMMVTLSEDLRTAFREYNAVQKPLATWEAFVAWLGTVISQIPDDPKARAMRQLTSDAYHMHKTGKKLAGYLTDLNAIFFRACITDETHKVSYLLNGLDPAIADEMSVDPNTGIAWATYDAAAKWAIQKDNNRMAASLRRADNPADKGVPRGPMHAPPADAAMLAIQERREGQGGVHSHRGRGRGPSSYRGRGYRGGGRGGHVSRQEAQEGAKPDGSGHGGARGGRGTDGVGIHGRGRGGTRRIDGDCFKCGKYGHRAEDCRGGKRQRVDKGPQGTQQGAPQGAQQGA